MQLKCNKNGDFTILVIGDPQLDWPEVEHEAPEEITVLLERVRPDFVVMNGDLKTNNEFDAAYVDNIFRPIKERGIPWAYTNGNHDRFTPEHHELLSAYGTCLSVPMSADDPNYDAERPLNFVLPIYSHDEKKQVFAVWGMDTGMYNQFGWEGVTAQQIAWYRKTSDALTAANGAPVTGVLCCHIALPQIVDLYYSKKTGGEAVPMERGDAYIGYGLVSQGLGEKEYVTDTGTVIHGANGFSCTNRANDRGMFQAIVQQGDIKMAVFAHEHKKNFVGHYRGVLLGYTGKISMGCGADERTRGGRVIRFNERDPENFTTWWVGSMETSADLPAIHRDGNVVE